MYTDIDGRYEFEDTRTRIPLLFSSGANGVIIVQEWHKTQYQ